MVHGYSHIVVFVPIHTDGIRVNVDVYNPAHRQVKISENIVLCNYNSSCYEKFQISTTCYIILQVSVDLPRWITGAFSYPVIDNTVVGSVYYNLSLKGKLKFLVFPL